MPVADLAGQDGLLSRFLGVKADGLALEVVQALVKGTGLGDAGVGRQVAPQHRHAAGIAKGIVHGVIHQAGGGIAVFVRGDVLRQRMRGDGHGVRLQHGLQVLHQPGHTAVIIEVDDIILAGGIHLGDLGGSAGQGVELIQDSDVQPRLVGDGRQVHDGVGGAAHGQARLDGVADGAVGDDLPGGDLLFHQLHDLHAGLLSHHHADGGGGGGQTAVRQGHAQSLGQSAHGIGSTQIGARAAAGAGGVLESHILRLCNLSGGEHSVGLGAGGLVGLAAVKLHTALHGAAGQEDAGDVQPGSGHQHAGDDLIAGPQQNQAVKQVDLRHGLDGVGDQLPGGKDVVHPVMALAHAVAAADDAKLNGGASGPVDAILYPLGHLPEIIMAGHALTPCVGDADHRPLQVLRGEAHGLQRRPVVLVP